MDSLDENFPDNDQELNLLEINLSLTPEERIRKHQKALSVPQFGKTCLVISLDDLIKAKSAMTRPIDKIVSEKSLKIKKSK